MQKGLIENKNNLLDELDKIKASVDKEQRSLTDNEISRIDEIEAEIGRIERTIKITNEERDKEFAKSMNDNLTQGNSANIIAPNEQITKRSYPSEQMGLDLGELVKVMAGKGNNQSKEDRYYRTMSTSGNKVLIPQELSDRIIDAAREQSALFGKIPTVQMRYNNMRVVVQTGDAQANFVNENDLIPSSQAIFTSIDLEGQTLALFVPISEKLLNSTMNLSSQLTYACSQAIAVALDKALLYGKGISADNSVPHEIKGVCTYDTINKEAHNNTVSYDAIIKGISAVKKNNIQPTNICYSSTIASDLAMLKDATGQYISEPKLLADYTISESNNMKEKDLLIYDRDSLLMGIHKGITIEWGHTADMFQRMQKGLRIYIRADLGVTRPKGITLVSTTVRGIDEEIDIKKSKTK